MKTPIRSFLVGFFLILVWSFSTQAAPPTGTYLAPGSFLPGTWQELLKNGLEGSPGNEISAQSTGYFLFEGATIVDPPLPIEIIPPIDCTGNAQEFKTVYQNGSLTLYNSVDAPWRQITDPSTYKIDLPLVYVTTCKFLDAEGAATGEISFLLKATGNITGFPGYTAEIEGKFAGTPELTPAGNDMIMSGRLDSAKIVIKGTVAAVDIKPGSCPNPINIKSQGVLPVAILGSSNLNVRDIDPATITLEGVSPLRWAIEDVGTPFNPLFLRDDRLDCNAAGFDGFPDLTLKFDTQALVEKLGLTNADDRSTQVWTLNFKLKDGTMLSGTDVVWILNKTRNGNNGNQFGRGKHQRQ